MFGKLIRKIRKVLSWGIYKSIPEDDLLERQRYKLFFTFSITCFLLCFAESFHAMSFDTGNNILGAGLQTFAAIFLVNYIWLQRHKQLRIAYMVCLATAFACVHLFNYYYGGIRNAGNFYYLFMIIATVILLGNKQGWIMLGLSVVNMVYFYFISDDPEMVSNVLAANPSDLNQDFLFSTVMAVIAIAALSNSLGSSKNIVIEKIRESQEILAIKNKELQKLSLVASKTDSAVIITNSDFEINWVNDAFQRLSGYELSEIAGKSSQDLLHGSATDFATIQFMHQRLNAKETFVGELEQYHKNGATFWSQVSITPIVDPCW
jgi:PAS domain S-box-containing protein